MPVPLLQTKFHRPTLLPTLAPRPRLFAKLNAGLQGKLTLVAAPAGFGKSTLIGDWLHQTPLPAVWLSLDTSDNDLQRFLRYLLGALQKANPTLGQATGNLLQLPQPAPVEELLTPLLNDLATLPQKLILVLDDYHVIEAPALHQALTFLLERLPAQLHLVITSRANPPLPLARLRGRGELTELRAADLRFTPAEVVTFFQHFAHLTLTPSDLALLTERTEGWIVGLQLAALSLEHRTDVTRFVQEFSGSNRFVLDYLLEEVLEQRPAPIQTFLLATSLLERMCGPLCDALLGDRLDRPAQQLLHEIEQANLFVIALDDERYWYRYHHLFAGMLQQRLRQTDPARIPELHRRASHWFEAQGLLDEAIEHARRAGDMARVTQLMEPEIRSFIMRGFFDTATRWLATLPTALIQERPRLLLAQAWLRLFEIPIGDTEAALQQAENLLGKQATPTQEDQQSGAPTHDQTQAETTALLAEITTLRAVEAGVRGQPTAPRLMQDALHLAGPANLFVQGVISYAVASVEWQNEPWPTIQESFQRAITAAEASENVVLAAGSRYKFALLQMERGDLAAADALLAQAERFARSQPNRWPWPIVDSARIGLGRLCYERNELAAALSLLQQGLDLGQRRRNIYVIIDGYLTLAWVHQAQGAPALAQAALDQAHALVSHTTRPATPPLVAAHQARLWLAQGQADRALAWVESQQRHATAQQMHLVRDLALAAITIPQGPAAARDALALLDRLTDAATAWAGRRLQILALQALAFAQLAQPIAAHQALQAAVAIGEKAGYVRLLVDQGPALGPLLKQLPVTPYREQLLTALAAMPAMSTPASTPASQGPLPATGNQSLIEPLSERELEVLRLVITDASNQAIADQLVITVGTVKNHMTNILGKLGVPNRRAAIRRAAELGLL